MEGLSETPYFLHIPTDRILENWQKLVNDEDTVLIPGDISWAMQLQAARADLEEIGRLPGKKAELVIWTTTPWTLPANLAICVHPEVTYLAYDLKGRVLVVAQDLLTAFLTEIAPDELAVREVEVGNTSADAVQKPSLSVAALKDPTRIL